ncbi:hypothetical protein HPB52_000273 [Rhipicephalus sanguineus]|uniref:Tick transposon n=1 Tax=Rhipicephalus sanguineus TaxID=34632 RepID=A0A9D4SX14_RHISA|nr:hypothetical protein HPB52_000273 [Rhipicephalus sanguineus]
MASPIPPPLFLSTPGDPPIPWADWKLIFEAYVDAIGNDARKPERRKALLLNALGYAGLKLYQTFSSANASETPASSDVFQAALALFDDHFKDASCDYVARLRFQERRQLPGEPVECGHKRYARQTHSAVYGPQPILNACISDICLRLPTRPLFSAMDPIEVTSERDSLSDEVPADDSPPTPLRYFKKHQSGNILGSAVRQLILNCYIKLRHRKPYPSVAEACDTVADLLGVSPSTVYSVRNDAKVTDGVLTTPSRKRPARVGKDRRTTLYDDFTKCALRTCVHSFFRRNERWFPFSPVRFRPA